MAEFIFLYRRSAEMSQQSMGTPEQAQLSMQRWLAWMRDLDARGHIKDAGQPLDNTGKVMRGPSETITDGPYAESKDLVGGFTIVEAKDLAEAATLAKGCPILAGGGMVEVRPVLKMSM
jgi:hypothetical protein